MDDVRRQPSSFATKKDINALDNQAQACES